MGETDMGGDESTISANLEPIDREIDALGERFWSKMMRDFTCVGINGENLNMDRQLPAIDNLLKRDDTEHDLYFYHGDHLGSSSYITDINGDATQHMQYLPFGEDFIHEQNATSYYTPYTFSAKERDMETQYSYFGARYYDAGLSIWLSVDPMSDKYPSLSPYNYCAWNPVMLIDPDGRSFDLFIEGTESSSAFEQLQSSTSLSLTRDSETGRISATGTPQNSDDALLLEAINNPNVSVHMNATHNDETSTGRGLIGGAFMGNIIAEDGDLLSVKPFERGGTVNCFQEVNTCDLQAMDNYTNTPGKHILHEVTEAYKGGLISLETGTSAGVGSRTNFIYNRAHNEATPQRASLFGEFIDGTNIFTTYLTGGTNGNQVLKSHRVPY